MKKQILNLSLLLALVVLIGSCGKYEDGPAISLLTKKSRLAGTWKIEKTFKNDVEEELPADAENSSMFVEKDGTGKMIYSSGSLSFNIDFEWEFGDGKETIKIRVKNLTGNWEEWEESTILRLTNKEFWIKDTSTNSTDVYITHFRKE